MRVIDIYVAITILSILVETLVIARCIRYIRRNYRKRKRISSRTIRGTMLHLLKDYVQIFLKCLIPIYHILIILGLLMMLVLDDAELNLSAMGFNFIECKFKE